MKRLKIEDRRLTVKGLVLLSLSLFPLLSLAQRPTGLGASSMVNPVMERGIQRQTALHKGDVLTIVVSETMQGQYAASTSTSKDYSATTDGSTIPLIGALSKSALGGILGRKTPQQLINALLGADSVSGKTTSDGSGTATTSGSFTGTMTVVVTDVDPSGNLLVRGTRDIRVNKETQRMVLTGLVRPNDVALDNTVQSSQVANASIQADGKGAVADSTRRGFLSRILGWLF